MKNFFIGALFGLVVATVGFNGLAKMLDNMVIKVKTVVQETQQ
jgi:hypothetical protein